ncbi:MAG: hypothetical protein U0324_27715 [Polyangiales bacterium]
MARPSPPEARLVDTRQVLVALSPLADERLAADFCGAVFTDPSALPDLADKAVYLCGDLARADALDLANARRVFVVRELSRNAPEAGGRPRWPLVDVGRVPVRVHGVGVYYRRFFDPAGGHFRRVCAEHALQSLTESTKPAKAHRTGIYLTPVRREGDALHFRLLRCSTNLAGPTENFRATDRHAVDALNQEAALVFEGAAPLNHVLAQAYHNTPADAEHRQAKARISPHADKTKDMPRDGVMAFCTFYDRLDGLRPMPDDPFDLGHGRTSGLTRLRFRRKEGAPEGAALPAQFTLTLYPGSVFFMPLSTNRFYVHEIVPSELDAARLPTRLGYVVRCSDAEAVHRDGRTFLVADDGSLAPLEAPTPEGMNELRRLYAEENRSCGFVDYGDSIRFSMNEGDYRAPAYDPADEFRVYEVPAPDGLFAELSASAPFEDTGKGRRGAVLVADDPRGVPLVRTTTRYARPAQAFRAVHAWLAEEIRARASLPKRFNNALIERYVAACTTMGAHSDQALDLDGDSEIALFSCYEDPARPTRRLLVEPKEPGGAAFSIALPHHGVVVFSTDANRRFRHRIVLDAAPGAADNPWVGVTYRTSKTFVRYADSGAHLADGARLTLANDDEARALYGLRRRENHETDFAWPRLDRTVSASDLTPPTR